MSEDEIIELTKKHANRTGGGHYQRDWLADKPWCCDRCQHIYDAIKEAVAR